MQPPIKLDDLFPKKIRGSCQFHFSKGWEIVRQNITKNGMLFHIFSTRFLTKFLDRKHSFYIRDFFRLLNEERKIVNCYENRVNYYFFVLFAATRLTNPLRVFFISFTNGFQLPLCKHQRRPNKRHKANETKTECLHTKYNKNHNCHEGCSHSNICSQFCNTHFQFKFSKWFVQSG